MELDYEILSVEELFEAGQSEKKKQQNTRLDEIEGTSWSSYAQNIIKHTEDGGMYTILTRLLKYGLGRAKTCDTNRKMSESFLIVRTSGMSMINYKRLGNTPDEIVGIKEINLALVEVTVLLCILSDKLEVKFKNYFPVPHDSKSFIIALSDQRILPLYGAGDFKCSKSKEFDDALVGVLDCVSQLIAATKNVTPNQNAPHEIEDDKLKDSETDRLYTIRTQSSSSTHWSRAMTFLLHDMKWLVKWVILYVHKLEPFPNIDQYLKKCTCDKS